MSTNNPKLQPLWRYLPTQPVFYKKNFIPLELLIPIHPWNINVSNSNETWHYNVPVTSPSTRHHVIDPQPWRHLRWLITPSVGGGNILAIPQLKKSCKEISALAN